MNTLLPGEDPSDELAQVYRRLGGDDPSRPSATVRDAIHAQAKLAAEKYERDMMPERLGPIRPQTNASHWPWKAAAAIAVAGLVGLVAWNGMRVATPVSAPQQLSRSVVDDERLPGAITDADARKPDNAPVQPPVVASTATRRRAAEPESTALASPRVAAPAGSPTAAVTQFPMGGASSQARQASAASASAAPSAVVSGGLVRNYDSPQVSAFTGGARSLPAVATADSSRWIDRVLLAVRASYPEVLGAARQADSVQVTIVLNSNGTVFKSAQGHATTGGQPNAPEQIETLLGVHAEDLATSGITAIPTQATDNPNAIVVVFGVLKHDRSE
jgi:hypothetical protein